MGLVKGDVGLGSTDNTADSAKPVSTAQQTALNAKQTSFTQTATKTASYTAQPNEIVVIDTSGGTFIVTGPTAGGPWGWRWKTGTTAPTIAAPAGYTIVGSASVTPSLAPGGSSGEFVTYQAFSTDYQPMLNVKPLATLDARYGAVLNTHLLAWAYAQAFRLVSATRDANEAITTASVVWPDGSTGTFTTDTASTAFPGAIDAYHVTYIPASGPTKTIAQTAVTRDGAGAVTAQPGLVVS
jgi:hypothetical protein